MKKVQLCVIFNNIIYTNKFVNKIKTGLTKDQIIRKVVQSFDINLPEIQETSTENQAGSSSQPQTRSNSQPQAGRSSHPIGNFINELISRHTNQYQSQRQSTLESELISFSEIKNTYNNALHFWNKNAKSFPHLAAIAKVLLGIPITTAKAEGAFSISGCLLRDKRASIDPLRAEKVLFIHDNYFLTQ